MNWDNIRVFIHVNRLGSIAKAAERLDINHSTVLRRLNQLESELNVQLFSRSTKGYEITPAGEELLEQAVAMETHAQALQRQAASNKKESSGKLAIAIPPAGSIDLIPAMAAFRKQNPTIELNLNAQIALSDLNKLEAEVSIRFTNEPPNDYVGFKLLELPYKIYASEAYLKANPGITSIDVVPEWIIINVTGLNNDFEPWVKSLPSQPKISVRTNSTELAAEAVASDLGVTFLPEHISKKFPNIVEVPMDPFHSSIGIWIFTHQDLRFQPRVKNFIQFMRKQLPIHYPEYALVTG